ncbi:MAG TPA: PEP-CTERM sorting domain-containing protein [Methylophilaceae bacterium]|nr:PEP-CTERM sorting domain-containing protein [Methylophilaceae bacterium]
MQKWLLAATALLSFISSSQALEDRDYFPPDDAFITYAGTPHYPDNYNDNPPIFDSISNFDTIDDVLGERGFVGIIKKATIGVDLFYKGIKVGEVQNVKASPFPNILFTDAKFFISEPGISKYSYVPNCPAVECEPVVFYSDTHVSLTGATFHYWNYTANPIPEPETYAMMLSGLAFIGMAGRRKRKL